MCIATKPLNGQRTHNTCIRVVNREEFEKSLPRNCGSIAAIRKTTGAQIRKLDFDLSSEDVRGVLDALKTDPLETELAGGGGGGRGTGGSGGGGGWDDEAAGDDAMARRRKSRAALLGGDSSPGEVMSGA